MIGFKSAMLQGTCKPWFMDGTKSTRFKKFFFKVRTFSRYTHFYSEFGHYSLDFQI